MGSLPPGVSGNYEPEAPQSWPVGPFPRRLEDSEHGLTALFEELFEENGPMGTTYAAMVIHHGEVVAERYSGSLPSFIDEPIPVTPTTPLLSWSMAKSMIGIMVGMLVTDGVLDLDAPATVPEWATPGDPRGAITLRNLMEMRDGLDFNEEYSDAGVSDVIEMLFGSGKSDMAHYAAERPLLVEPGTRYNYSSGTSNIIARIVGDAYGGELGMRAALTDRLFGPLAMNATVPTFDEAGTFVASSFVHAPAEDYARFGQMLLQGGKANGKQIVPESWIDWVRTPISIDEEDGLYYSAQFWVVGDEFGTFWCSGYEGQMISVCPPLGLVVVRLGHTAEDQTHLLKEWRNRLTAYFAAGNHSSS
jgi:CubicO group peptidase (beta-lactamase class C family)